MQLETVTNLTAGAPVALLKPRTSAFGVVVSVLAVCLLLVVVVIMVAGMLGSGSF